MGWFHSLTSFVSSNWKTIAVVAAGTLIFGAALVLTGGTAALLAPTLGQLLVAGVASGMGSQLVSDLLNGQTPGWDIVKAGAVSGVITVATAGLGRFVPGLATPLENPWAQRAVVTATGGVAGAGAQVLDNAIEGKPLGDNVLAAAGRGAATTALASEGIRLVAPRILGTPPAEETPVPPPRPVEMVDPNTLRFSQTTAGGGGRTPALRQSMAENGWQGDPVDVVKTPSGNLVTIDNTRVALAQELGIEKIPVTVHPADEPLPASMTTPGDERFGTDSKTWGDALAYRASKQRPRIGPEGTPDRPRLKEGGTPVDTPQPSSPGFTQELGKVSTP
jgi:hypothetical protein